MPNWGRIFSRQVHPCSRSAQLAEQSATPSKASWNQFESDDDGRHLKRKPLPSASIFTCKLIPLNEQALVQFGSEDQNCRSKTCMLTSPRSHARAPHERNLALILKMSISNWSPINSLHDLRLHFWKPWPNRREYRASSPKLSSTREDEQYQKDTRCDLSNPN